MCVCSIRRQSRVRKSMNFIYWYIQMQVYVQTYGCLPQTGKRTRFSEMKWNTSYSIIRIVYRIFVSFDSIVFFICRKCGACVHGGGTTVNVDRCQGNTINYDQPTALNLYNVYWICCNTQLVNCIELPTLSMLCSHKSSQ